MVLVELSLARNPKAVRKKPFVAEIKGDRLAFLRASIPYFDRGVLVGGKYGLEEGKHYILRRDLSSHKNSYQEYSLFTVENGEIKELARISYVNGTPEFSDPSLEEIYVESERNPIQALILYSSHSSRR